MYDPRFPFATRESQPQDYKGKDKINKLVKELPSHKNCC